MTDTPRTDAWDALYDDFRANHGTSHWSNILTRHRAAIEAKAHAEGLDVEVLARALKRCWNYPAGSREQAEAIIREYRAILAGETE